MVIAILTILGTSSTAFASSVHFKKPAPTFSKDATTFAVTASGINLSGLGSGDIKIDISAVGTATALCQNPGGSSKVPGQNPVAVTASGTVFLPGNAVKNGSVLGITATTAGVPTPTTSEAGCPNSSWSVVGMTVSYSSVTLTISQDGNGNDAFFDEANATVVLTQTFNVSL
jgi:hypothetical protein